MAAGLGFKTFNTGDVLSAADVNGYLMQGVLVFADATARDAAITSPQEGQFAFTKNNDSLWYYNGTSWVASGATGDIEGVTAGTGISGGGTSGTVTITNSMATAIDAKGDLIVGTGADTFSRLAVGTNGHTLVADSAEATGLKWAAPAGGGGKVLQVVQATTATQVVVASTTMTDSGLSASITPSSATSKILIIATQGSEITRQASDSGAQYRIMRDATQIWTTGTSSYNWLYLPSTSATQLTRELFQTICYLDSPSSTSSITYKTQGAAYQSTNSGKITFQNANQQTSTIILMEIGA